MSESTTRQASAVFAAGCFWGVQKSFASLAGVLDTEVGYTGGHKDYPTYEELCRDATGHAEAVRVRFDEEKISYTELLDHFWAIHDPTQHNRQGPDVGSQYRSGIFTLSPAQNAAAEASLAHMQKKRKQKFATRIQPLQQWWKAEEYHQHYLRKR